MVSISPFRFDGNDVKIDPEMLVYDEFKQVYDLDLNTKKELALKWFIYIYHCADQRAVPILKGYNTKDKHEYACRQSKLPLEFKPEIRILNAIDFYRNNFISPIKELSISLLNTLQKNIKILKKANDLIDSKIEKDELTPEEIGALILLVKDISTMSTQLSTQMKTVRELDAQMTIVDSTDKEVQRGGNEISDSMTRDGKIEG
jgi:hypothetical protein